MSKIMPQEIEVWYVLPALRKELAKSFVKDFSLSQKDAADILGITEAAISQYIKDKRGTEIKFTPADKEKIKASAKKMIDDRKDMVKILYDLCKMFRGNPTVCKCHKSHDHTLPQKCRICCSDGE